MVTFSRCLGIHTFNCMGIQQYRDNEVLYATRFSLWCFARKQCASDFTGTFIVTLSTLLKYCDKNVTLSYFLFMICRVINHWYLFPPFLNFTCWLKKGSLQFIERRVLSLVCVVMLWCLLNFRVLYFAFFPPRSIYLPLLCNLLFLAQIIKRLLRCIEILKICEFAGQFIC